MNILLNSKREVKYSNFPAQYAEERDEIHAIVDRVFERGVFVSLALLDGFEEAVADYCGVSDAIGVASGTDALYLAMKAMDIGPGDEVITPPNSHFSSTSAIIQTGATPAFADVMDDQNIDPAAIEAAITPRTKAIMPVHLTGRIADMNAILEIASRHGLRIIEDAAQSMGSRYHGEMSGSFGDAAAFSAHPLKNLNAAGDAGFITTNDEAIARRLRKLRHNGLEGRDTVIEWGSVSRLDVLQAEILRMRLAKLDAVVARRRSNAALYRESLAASSSVFAPPCKPHEFNSFHIFVIQVDRREELIKFLVSGGVQTAIHYPIPIHLQPAAEDLGYKKGRLPVSEDQADRILSLPINQYVDPSDIQYTAGLINEFFGER